MSLKSISQSIKAGDYDTAEKEILALDKNGTATAMVYLCGVRCETENGKLNTALQFLQKAKELDPKNAEILKAECSIYEKFPEQVSKDHISLFDKVIADEKISESRRENLKKVKWTSMIRLGLINDFQQLKDYSEAMQNVEVCGKILNASNLDKRITSEMAKKAFLNTKDQLSQKQHLYGTLLFQNEPQFDEFALEHATRFGTDDPNIMKNVYSRIALELIKNDGQLSPAFAEAVKTKEFVPQKKATTEWLTHLFSDEIGKAYDSMTKLSPDEYRFWPLSGLAYYTFYVTRQFSKLIKLYRSVSFPDDNIFKVIEIEALFEHHADEIELKQILQTIEYSVVKDDKRIIEIQLKILILLGICDENEINSSDLDEGIKDGLLAELYFVTKDYSNAKEAAERCLESLSVKDQWRMKLILARLKWLVDEDFDEGEIELRQLYSENPFVADILAAMAEFYFEIEEFDSAKQVIDHAVLLNPSNRNLRQFQDNIYSALKLPIEERIQKLNEYIAIKPYSMWAVRYVTVLEIQSGRFEEAISKLRRVIHALPDDVDDEVRQNAAAIWAYVGLVNFHRGQARSAMYALDSAVSLEPDNPSYLLQLALAQKNLYKFEEVFTTFKKLAAFESTPEIRKLTHTLFLESLAVYASQLPPGEKQLRQLLTLFKSVGKMLITEWCSSHSLSLSIANALSLLKKYNSDIIDAVLSEIPEFAQKCGFTKKEDILNADITIMLNLLSTEQNVGALNETGNRLLAYAIEKNSEKFATIAQRYYKKAILLPGQISEIRSILYLNLGLTFCVGTVNHEKALHCFLRSLRLNKSNPTALSIIGLLCLKMNDFKNAKQAFNNAHILEPLQIEHWCGRAMLSQLQDEQNLTETMNSFQHSLTIKPCVQAVEAFSYYLIKAKASGQKIDRFDFDFTSIRHLIYIHKHSDQLLYSMAIFAEHFRHFDEAAFLIQKVSSNLNVSDATKARILSPVQTSQMSSSISHAGIERLYKIYHGTLPEAVVAAGFKSTVLITFLLRSLANDQWPVFWKFFRANLYPLLVGFVNALEMDSFWSRGIIATLRTNRPPHKFLQVFPVATPKHSDLASIFRPREGETAFVLYDPSIEPLFQLLSSLKEKYDAENPKSDDEFIIFPSYNNDDSQQIDPYDETEVESTENGDTETQSDISHPI